MDVTSPNIEIILSCLLVWVKRPASHIKFSKPTRKLVTGSAKPSANRTAATAKSHLDNIEADDFSPPSTYLLETPVFAGPVKVGDPW